MPSKRPKSESGVKDAVPETGLDLSLRPFQTDADFQSLFIWASDYALKNFASKMASDSGKDSAASAADVIRLAQFRRELKAEEPIQKVEVQWVDRSVTESLE